MELSAIAGIPAFILDTLYIFTSLASYCSTLEDFHSMVSCFKLKQIKIRLAFTLHFAIATEVFRYPSLEIESTTNRLSSLRRHSGWYAYLALIFLILAHKCLEWVNPELALPSYSQSLRKPNLSWEHIYSYYCLPTRTQNSPHTFLPQNKIKMPSFWKDTHA